MRLKERIEKLFVLPIAKHLKVNPNIITLLGIVAMLLAFVLVLIDNLYFAALFVFISGFLDLLDGSVAKYHKRVTKFGAFLDRVADRINDALILSAIILAGLIDANLGIFVLVFILISSYASSVLESQTKKNIGEKLSFRGLRLLIIVVALLFNLVTYAFYLLALIAVFAFFERLYTARAVLK